MIKDVVLATRNPHKLREIAAIMAGLNLRLLSSSDFPDLPDIEESGETFAENALLKAQTVYRHARLLTLSDDSGLEVDALNGAPGVYSARYSGVDDALRRHAANNEKLLRELKGVPPPQRGGQFHCAVAIVGSNFGKVVHGIVRGKIAEDLHGRGGFGYDPLFIPQGYSQTFAELGPAIKNRISHRARAFRKARAVLTEILPGM